MRQREQVDQWWEVRGHDRRLIVTTWGDDGKASAWRSVRAAARRGEARTVHRATRYRLAPLVEEGGYIPLADHRVPPDVPFTNYMFYLELARKVWGKGVNLKPFPGTKPK
jgi:hypothetical protein